MDNADAAKEWFVTHEGRQFGPVSIDDLKFEVERGELNPRLDMVWKNGMEDWIPAGELDGLFEKNDAAKAAEEAKVSSGNFTGYVSGDTPEDMERAMGKRPGAGRGAFFFFCYVFPVLWGLGIGFGMPLLEGKVSAEIMGLLPLGLILVPFVLSISVTLKRFQNLGMTRWWFLGLFVPFLGIWVYYRTFACPPGYAIGKKMDPLGWVLAILYWLVILVATASVAAVIYFSAIDPDKLRGLLPEEDLRKFSEVIEKAKQAQGQPDAPETEAGAPANPNPY
ncbi:DUF4339 domain-containing protein [Akkermansiaceae bacterium]|nr:DUF4339 domain-containing protein [Akkermansiaceae bacterium]